ncbi:MAG: hypothetical protein KC684_07560, partial [Candidatus Omnitrophica bacterium]|nr:hypothetical protein [Candidatus Omnitrophota bacterium]
MIKIGRRVFIKIFYILIDIFFLGLSIYCAALIRHVETLPFDVSIYNLFVNPKNDFRFVFYCWFVVMIYLNNTNRLYETRREIFELEEIWNVFKSSVFSSLLIVVIIYISRIEYFPRSVFLLIAAFMTLTFSLWRMVKKACVSFAVSRGYNNFNVLIIGANKVGQSLVKEIRKRPQLGLNVIGFIDDYVTRKIESLKLPVLGTTSDFGEIAKRQFIDKVFIVGHYHEDVFMDILQKCKRQGIAVRV